ncbi:MFS transporter [Erwinia amylovora]|uniref:MFS transporter n=1 Tax=Erwinia amylovora TaxID=552 RepID=UPI001443C9A0|nr:MFS transporter [Erwinia amylovora]
MNNRRTFWLAIMMLTLPVLLGALAMDMLLPALPDMAMSLGLAPQQIQWMLNVFILGFALSQLLVGFSATRLGDHHLLMIAIVLYILSSVGIAAVASYPWILALRFIQALASCTTMVISMALVTQTFHTSLATKGHSILSGLTSLGPLLAPVGGIAILNMGGSWRTIFLLLALTGCVIFLLFVRVSPLFHWRERPAPRQSYSQIAKSPSFWRYAICSSTGMCWIFLFFSTAPFIVHSACQRNNWMLAWVFLLASLCFMIGSYLGARLHGKRPKEYFFDRCIVIQMMLSAAIFMSSMVNSLPFYVFIVWIMLMQLNCGLYFGPAISFALQKFPEVPVQAAAFQGFQQFLTTFLVSGVLLMFFKYTLSGLSLMAFIVSVLAVSIISVIKYKYGV